MDQNEKLGLIVKTLDKKKADSIQVIKISDLTIIADYFVIAGGGSSTQTRTLAEEVEYQMSQKGVEPLRKEGYGGSEWVILDYGDIVVHVFYKDTRQFYKLESNWADGEQIDISEYLVKE